MQGLAERIRGRRLAHCYKADPAYGTGVAKKLGINPDTVKDYAKMTFGELVKATTEDAFAETNGVSE